MLFTQLAALVLAAAALLVVAGCGGSSKTSSSITTSTTTTSAATSPTTGATSTTPTTITHSTTVTVASGKPLTRTQWIAKGDVICAQTSSKLAATTATTSQDYARVLPQAAAYDKAEAVELSKLVPPAALRSDWSKLVNDVQLFGEYTARVGEYAQANNLPSAHPLVQQGEKFHIQMLAIAKRDGFKQCATLS